jgi:two-component system NtrC family sensor kinase
MIATAVERAERLTNHLLAFSRQKTHVMETVDLRTHLSSIEDVLQRSLRGDIRIELSVAREPCIVLADLNELELAVLNVAVNARDAMPQGGTLSIDVRRRALDGTDNPGGLKGDFIAIRIADTGSGIPADVLPRVFEPFFTTKEVGKGTGLGLSQVYGFASQSGGTITIDTEPGRGTAVTILLPRVEALTAQQPQAKADDDAHPPGDATVLVVEDNQEVAEVCQSYLHQLGYRVVMADNAQAGLAIVRGGAAIDLVLTDVVMAGEMNGIDLARQLRSDHAKLPIILTTGYSTDVSLTSNEFPLIRKPYSLAELRKRLDEALGRQGQSGEAD